MRAESVCGARRCNDLLSRSVHYAATLVKSLHESVCLSGARNVASAVYAERRASAGQGGVMTCLAAPFITRRHSSSHYTSLFVCLVHLTWPVQCMQSGERLRGKAVAESVCGARRCNDLFSRTVHYAATLVKSLHESVCLTGAPNVASAVYAERRASAGQGGVMTCLAAPFIKRRHSSSHYTSLFVCLVHLTWPVQCMQSGERLQGKAV
ncbi:hypothetical protein J6590_016581 [Homalodisca vitripennis]|nr:hypothetical protein J6590_016581 [Homalodisca vitripennis]